MDITQTVSEVFDPTFEAIGDSELNYDQKRAMLYNLYCFACAVYPGYVAKPCRTLFEYGCCFLIEPERHPDYAENKAAFTHTAVSEDVLPGGGRWYVRDGREFVKYDYGSTLFDKLLTAGVIPPQDRSPIPTLSLYAAVYLACNMVRSIRPLWFTYYFYLDATNEPVDEEFDTKLWELLRDDNVFAGALEVRGSMLIGDESELGAGKLLDFYAPFIAYRRSHIFDVFEKRINAGDPDYVAEYSAEMLKCYPENHDLMKWNAAARTECVARDRDESKLNELITDLRDYVKECDSPTLQRYLKLAVMLRKNLQNQL